MKLEDVAGQVWHDLGWHAPVVSVEELAAAPPTVPPDWLQKILDILMSFLGGGCSPLAMHRRMLRQGILEQRIAKDVVRQHEPNPANWLDLTAAFQRTAKRIAQAATGQADVADLMAQVGQRI